MKPEWQKDIRDKSNKRHGNRGTEARMTERHKGQK